ncbi:hypothetical protein GW17_00061084 [Ensete ventricosum]|nr:hypothetical protein GW17_00061084 [Ensete ventricosum]
MTRVVTCMNVGEEKVGEEKVMVCVAVLGEDVKQGVDRVVVAMEFVSCTEDAVLDDEEANDLREEDLVRLEKGSQGGDLEVRGELQFVILEVVSPEALLGIKGRVDVVGTGERGEIED